MITNMPNWHQLSHVQTALFKVLQHERDLRKLQLAQGNKPPFEGKMREVLGCRWVCVGGFLLVKFNSAIGSEYGGQPPQEKTTIFFPGCQGQLLPCEIYAKIYLVDVNIGALQCDALHGRCLLSGVMNCMQTQRHSSEVDHRLFFRCKSAGVWPEFEILLGLI